MMSGSNFTESSPFLLLFLLGYCLAMIEGELRCYCNESGCVVTGYMCKSSAGKCFTAVEIRGEVTHLTHGCLDNLSQEHQRSCRVGVDVISASQTEWKSGHLPFLLCCTEHMCNYREDIDVSIILTPKYNGTFHRGKVAPANQDGAIYSRNHRGSRDEDRELWFKAAVIAVPIAGGVILVLLVLLAVRMLRTDTRHHRRLIQIRQEHSLTKAHMYISEHFSGKSVKQHCSLFNENRPHVYSYADKKVTRSNNSTSHRSDNGCQTSLFCDNSKAYCGNSFHSGNRDKSNSISARDISTSNSSQTLQPRNSTHSITSHKTCSTNIGNFSQSNAHITCTFYTDSPSKITNSTRDTSVRVHKDGHTFPHATTLVPSGTLSQQGHSHQFDSTWEKTCLNGPAVV